MLEFAKGKKILFITTKNLDYIRNSQEIYELGKISEFTDVIGFKDKSYPKRLLKVYWSLLTKKVKKYDMAFIGFAPQLILPFFGFKFRKCEVAIDFFISMYDTLCCDRKKFGPKSIPGRLLKAIDKRTLKKADYIVADTKAHGKYFAEELGADEEKLEVLYLEADKSIYRPMDIDKDKSNKGRFTVLYFGSILPLQGIDIVLGALDILKDREDMYFYVIGPIGAEYTKPLSENIEYISWLSQEDLAEHIAVSDLCLAGHFNGCIEKARRTIPGKAYIYEAMGKPMILGDNPATRELYDESMQGIYFVPMSNAEALAEKISDISLMH